MSLEVCYTGFIDNARDVPSNHKDMSNTKTERVTTYLAVETKRMIANDAMAAGMSEAEYLRQILERIGYKTENKPLASRFKQRAGAAEAVR